MKKVIIAVVFLTVIIGGGAAGMLIAGYGPFAQNAVPEPVAEVAPEPETVKIDINALSVPLILENRPASHVQMRIQLVVAPENEDYVRGVIPKIQDAFLRDMLSFLPAHVQIKKKPDALDIQNRLRIIADRIVGDGRLEDLQVLDVMVR